MKIAVLSDSHYEEFCVKNIKKYLTDVDMILHCGDGAPDVKVLADEFNGKIYSVKGNCDISCDYPLYRVIEALGVKIFMTHGHMYNVKNEYNTIFYKGKEVGADIVVFGHSHKAFISNNDGLILMNPGSVTLPYLGSKKTIGFIEILENEKINVYIKELED